MICTETLGKDTYYAVIFSSHKNSDNQAYLAMSDLLEKKLKSYQGLLGIESIRNKDGFGITISYWESMDSIQSWKVDQDHMQAKAQGRALWYKDYMIRIAKVESQNYFIHE